MSTLRQLLDHALETPGLAIRTNNARRLMIDLRHEIARARKVHASAFSSLLIMTSKSPMEIYIVNKEFNSEGGTIQTPGDDPEGVGTTPAHHLP